MIKQKITAIAKACDGVIINRGDIEIINEISTDTRTIKEGNLFIPLAGENFDGHMFIGDAVKKGVAAVLVQEDKMESITGVGGINIIRVKDTLEALACIAY